MTEAELIAKQDQLAADRTKLERERLEFEQKRLQRMTVAVSAVALVISLLQVGVAFLQSRLATAQTIEKFIPHLQKQETRDAALLTMSVFTDRDFVTQLAEKLKATAVLETLQAKGSTEEKAQASEALSALDIKRADLIAQMFDANKQKRIAATTELVRQWAGDPKIVPQVIEAASTRLTNQSGIINSLVVLREAAPETLRANSAELAPFLEKAESNGPQTRELVADVSRKTTRVY
jgi:hypothetical protein